MSHRISLGLSSEENVMAALTSQMTETLYLHAELLDGSLL